MRSISLLLAVLMAGAGVYLLVPSGSAEETAHACPPGYLTKEQNERAERRAQGESAQPEREAGGTEGSCSRASTRSPRAS